MGPFVHIAWGMQDYFERFLELRVQLGRPARLLETIAQIQETAPAEPLRLPMPFHRWVALPS